MSWHSCVHEILNRYCQKYMDYYCVMIWRRLPCRLPRYFDVSLGMMHYVDRAVVVEREREREFDGRIGGSYSIIDSASSACVVMSSVLYLNSDTFIYLFVFVIYLVVAVRFKLRNIPSYELPLGWSLGKLSSNWIVRFTRDLWQLCMVVSWHVRMLTKAGLQGSGISSSST